MTATTDEMNPQPETVEIDVTVDETPAPAEAPRIEAEEAPVAAAEPVAPAAAEAAPEAPVAEEAGPKKPISLRVASDDLERAKAIAADLGIGYQTLLNQVIHQGLASAQADMHYRRAVAELKASIPAMGSAQALLDSPAVKAARELVADPAVKAAQDLLASPAVKAAQEFVEGVANHQAVQQVRDFGTSSFARASEELARSPISAALKQWLDSPAVRQAQAFAESTSAKVVQEVSNSPAGRISRELAQAAGIHVPAPGEELKELNKAIDEIRATLKKANLM